MPVSEDTLAAQIAAQCPSSAGNTIENAMFKGAENGAAPSFVGGFVIGLGFDEGTSVLAPATGAAAASVGAAAGATAGIGYGGMKAAFGVVEPEHSCVLQVRADNNLNSDWPLESAVQTLGSALKQTAKSGGGLIANMINKM